MRTILLLLSVLCSPAVARAQHAYAKIELQDGKVIIAPVESIDERAVTVIVRDRAYTFRFEDVRELKTLDQAAFEELGGTRVFYVREVEPIPPVEPADPLDEPAAKPEPESVEPGSATGGIEPQPAGQATPNPPAERLLQSRPSGDEPPRIIRILDRYLWFVPLAPSHKTSLAAALMLVLMLITVLSARMANLEVRSLPRCAGFAAIVLVFLTVEVLLLPVEPTCLAGALAFDLALWFVCVRSIFRTGVFGASVMMISFVLACLVGVLILELAGILLHGSELLGP